ncbi:MAG: ABC transporter ATP-binding protein [Clostridia bacterium]|nr:ABC transporter ATP-binding protein [Clostridia bacterium]
MESKQKRGPMGGRNRVAMPGEKAKDFKGTFRKLLKYLGKYKIAIVIVIIFAILSTIFSIVGPKILGEATTILFEGVMNMISENGLGIDFDGIRNIIITLLVLYIISAAFSYIQGWIMSKVTMDVTYKLRKDISHKINKLPLSYFDKKTQGEVLSYITNDVDTVSQTLNQGITQVITSITTLLGVLIMMLSISWQMTIVAVLVLPIAIILVAFVVKKSQKYFIKQQKHLSDVNGHIEEMYTNHTIVRAFNGQKQATEKFEQYNEKLYESAWKSQFLSGLMPPTMNFVGNLGYVAVCIMGAYYASIGIITVGNIQSFMQYMRSFIQPISQLANVSNVLQSTMAAAERVFEFLNEKEEVPDTDKPASVENVVGNVEFKNVHFGYNENKIVINDFSAKINAGQKIAIVGPTGAGKTTIVKLLMRYYDVISGAILLEGTDIRNFTRDDLRSQFGMVLQDTWSFNETIMENIRYGRLNATDEEVIKAAKEAQVDHFVRTLSDGYKTVLNEESTNISQGQKQLLTIARAFLADPKILILDEATSSVDTRTEILIQQAMEDLMKGRTSFVIAHRLSTIRDADLILVMNEGDIVEQGTHEELLQKGGFYEKLYNSQFENCD